MQDRGFGLITKVRGEGGARCVHQVEAEDRTSQTVEQVVYRLLDERRKGRCRGGRELAEESGKSMVRRERSLGPSEMQGEPGLEPAMSSVWGSVSTWSDGHMEMICLSICWDCHCSFLRRGECSDQGGEGHEQVWKMVIKQCR